MPRNKSEKSPRVLKERTVESGQGARTLYLVFIHDGSDQRGPSPEYRVAICETKGTTWRKFMAMDEALACFQALPDVVRGWDAHFPSSNWRCNDITLTNEGLDRQPWHAIAAR